ncbi:hypothetical protein AaE_004052 [Aphanomyces astaci]|uniref:Peptidase A2 domain-containing protein n=1 Tax=Aphanomyces astaci TaxID=112090 RepID=A0A6A5ANN3_APHAT|nr:hypothetical protein AaE_004052 [Aphanomyces astaci]
MLDALMRSLEQDHQEWVLHQEGKMVVEVMTKSIKPESMKTAVQKQLQLQWNKALMSDVFRYVNWLQTFAAGHQLYVGLDDESEPSPAAKPRPGRRRQQQWQSRRKGRNDCAEECRGPARKGCLKCAQVKRWKDGIKVLVNQPQRQKTERGVLLENIVRVDDVLLDSGSDVTVVTRGVMDAFDAAGVKVGTVSHSVPHLAYPYGSDAKPVVMTRSVKGSDTLVEVLSTLVNVCIFAAFTKVPWPKAEKKRGTKQPPVHPSELGGSFDVGMRGLVRGAAILECAGAPAAADIFGLHQGRKTRFYARVPEVSGSDQRSAVQWIASVRDARECLHGSVLESPDRAERLQPRPPLHHER